MTNTQTRNDDSVVMPAAVRAASAKSDTIAQSLQPTQDPSPTPTPTPTPTPPNDADAEHRVRSAEGRFKQADAAAKAALARNAELERLLALAHAEPKPAPTVAATTPTRLVTDEEITEYGNEFLTVVGKKAKEEIFPELEQLRGELKQLKGQVSGVGQHIVANAREELYSRLNNEVPTWKELNNNPEFLAWLDLQEPYSGAIRRELLNAAFQRNDATRVAAFFKGFTSDVAATTPPSSEPDLSRVTQPGVTQQGKPPKVPLASLAAPGRAKTAATSEVPVEKPIITRAMISQFYSEVRAGEFAGKDAEKKQIEDAIFAATREGRVK